MKTIKKHIVIFSHGFGVQKDSLGLFTQLAAVLASHQIESVLFDYNNIDLEKREVTVLPFSEQAKLLQTVIDRTCEQNPDANIDIIAHSQGAVMVALANLRGIRRVVLMSSFFHTNIHDVLERYKRFPESEINFIGISRRKRTDGTTTIIPPTYWSERFATDVYGLYNRLAETVDLTIINAGEDQIMDQCNLSKVFNACIINIHGDHDFKGESRKQLVSVVENIVIRK